jgi:hypothetical protein
MASTQKTNTYKPTYVRDTTDSSSTSTGSLLVFGGAGIIKKVFIGDLLTLSNNLTSTAGIFTITGGTSNFIIQPAATNIDITLSPSGTGRVLLNADPTSTLHAATKGYVDASRIYSITFATGALDYIVVNSSSVYTNVANFLWQGSTKFGTPTKAYIYAWCASTTATRFIRWRVFDVTNSTVICTSAITNSSTRDIIDMGAISNISSVQAIYVIQQQDTNAAGVPTTHTTNGNVSNFFFYRE